MPFTIWFTRRLFGVKLHVHADDVGTARLLWDTLAVTFLMLSTRP